MSSKRKPDYRIGVYDKVTKRTGRDLGAAWINDGGEIQIRLNPGAALIYDREVTIKLWPLEPPSGPFLADERDDFFAVEPIDADDIPF
jgi:hypothetical protein